MDTALDFANDRDAICDIARDMATDPREVASARALIADTEAAAAAGETNRRCAWLILSAARSLRVEAAQLVGGAA